MAIYFLILTELTSFLLSFVLWSSQVLGKDLMDYGIRSGKSLRFWMPKSTQVNIQGLTKQLSLGCPGWHPLFRLRSSVTLLEAIFLFTTWYVFCLERHFLLFIFACCYSETCFISFSSIKKSSIAFTMLILQVYTLLLWKQKVFYHCLNSSEKSERDKILNFFHNE